MQEVARQAIREYVENHSRADLLDRVWASRTLLLVLTWASMRPAGTR